MLDNETAWLNLSQMVLLFQHYRSLISRHITNIFKENELVKNSTVAKNAKVQLEGDR